MKSLKFQKKKKKPKAAVIHQHIEESDESAEEHYPFPHKEKLPNLLSKSPHFSSQDYEQLHKHIPRRFWYHEPKQVFQTEHDGTSYITFYSQAANLTPTLLIISDTKGHVFGAFTTEEWKKNPKNESVVGGTGETFLFSLRPDFNVYKWSKINEQFQLTGGTNISFGGDLFGGIWVDSTFSKGRSHSSETYLNDCLASSQEYEIHSVELWTLTSA